MEKIKNKEFSGERPLYNKCSLYLENVIIHPGESSIKEGRDIKARDCRFEGKYVFWCCEGVNVKNSYFAETARSSVWHSNTLDFCNCVVDAPKMFREASDIRLRDLKMPHAQETFWSCSNIDIDGFEAAEADYIFMHCSNVKVRNMKLYGNYSFQHARNVEIRDSLLESKDSLWESENVTVYDSFINGEYLAWHSRNLRLVRCRIGGTQPLCYCDGLVLEDCVFEADADLALEYSDVNATIKGVLPSIKNPLSGRVRAGGYGEIIIDQNLKLPGDCEISEVGELEL